MIGTEQGQIEDQHGLGIKLGQHSCCSKVNPFFSVVNVFKVEFQVYFLCRFSHFSCLLVKSMALLCFNLRGKHPLPFEAHAV